jgi:hypothetical protein
VRIGRKATPVTGVKRHPGAAPDGDLLDAFYCWPLTAITTPASLPAFADQFSAVVNLPYSICLWQQFMEKNI